MPCGAMHEILSVVFFSFLQYLASGKEVYNNHAAWHAAGTNLSSHRDFYYVIQNQPSLYFGYRVRHVLLDFLHVLL